MLLNNGFSVIIPFYNRLDLVKARLIDLYKFCFHEPLEIILVDDGSSEPGSRELVHFWRTKVEHHRIKYIRHLMNLGFSKAMNAGASHASGDVLVFLSNDVIILGDFLSEINEKLVKNEDVLIGGEVIDFPAGWNEFIIEGKRFFVPWVNGWLVACTKRVWDTLDGWDGELYGKFSMEDVDLSMQALSLGYNLVALNSPHLRHIGAQTAPYNEKRYETTMKNKEKFFAKWEDTLRTLFV